MKLLIKAADRAPLVMTLVGLHAAAVVFGGSALVVAAAALCGPLVCPAFCVVLWHMVGSGIIYSNALDKES